MRVKNGTRMVLLKKWNRQEICIQTKYWNQFTQNQSNVNQMCVCVCVYEEPYRTQKVSTFDQNFNVLIQTFSWRSNGRFRASLTKVRSATMLYNTAIRFGMLLN